MEVLLCLVLLLHSHGGTKYGAFWTPTIEDLIVLAAAIGALLRQYLANTFNPKPDQLFNASGERWFSLGTFLANVTAVIVYAVVFNYHTDSGNVTLWTYLFDTFFAGSLSTVSTFVKEFTTDVKLPQLNQVELKLTDTKNTCMEF